MPNIRSFPPRVLCTIFAIVLGIPDCNSDSYLDFLPLTHVCHAWRKAALECPGLWCFISNCRPDSIGTLLSEMNLSRSGSEPIEAHLIAGADYRGHKNSMTFILETLGQMERIQHLEIVDTGCGYLGNSSDEDEDEDMGESDSEGEEKESEDAIVIAQALSKQATILDSLNIKMFSSRAANFLHAPLFTKPGMTPCLLELETRNVVLPWDSPVFNSKTLVFIGLEEVSNLPTHAFKISQLLNIFANCPALEEFKLYMEVFSPDFVPLSEESGTQLDMVTAPSLWKLDIGVPGTVSVPLLHQLRLPAIGEIHVLQHGRPVRHINEICPNRPERFMGSQARALEVSHSYPEDVHLRVHYHEGGPTGDDSNDSVLEEGLSRLQVRSSGMGVVNRGDDPRENECEYDDDFEFHYKPFFDPNDSSSRGGAQPFAIILSALEEWDLTRVTSLTFKLWGTGYTSAEQISSVLEDLPNLNNLTFIDDQSSSYGQVVTSALMTPQLDAMKKKSKERWPAFLPKLQTITLNRLSLDARAYEQLRMFLQIRKRGGETLHSIVFEKCYVLPKYLMKVHTDFEGLVYKKSLNFLLFDPRANEDNQDDFW